MSELAEKPHYEGHRARLKSRFVDAGPQALADYELLELLLFMAIPRRDVKPLAKDLLKKFGGIENVFAADIDALQEVDGISEHAAIALKSVEAAAHRMMQASVMQQPVLSTWQRLLDYCHAVMAREKIEQFRVLYLNRKNILIADEIHQTGTVDQSAVFPREIVKSALSHGATAVILVHNHPSGDPTPSDADITLTHDMIRAMEPLGIVVHDHLIIAKTGHTSFKKSGLM
jgi:DNA repair protein RadC